MASTVNYGGEGGGQSDIGKFQTAKMAVHLGWREEFCADRMGGFLGGGAGSFADGAGRDRWSGVVTDSVLPTPSPPPPVDH